MQKVDDTVDRESPEGGAIWPDLLAFGLGLAMSWHFQWRTTELVWSLWLSSLVVGYLTIVSVIASGAYLGSRVVSHPGFARDKTLLAVSLGGGFALFLLGFFTLHFCGFHAGHAVFLSHFFPLPDLDPGRFSSAFMNPVLLWHTALTQVVPLFGLFMLPVVIAERRALLSPWRSAHTLAERMRNTPVPESEPSGRPESPFAPHKQGGDRKQNPMGDALFGPYRNVVRMHLLIFVFAGLSVLGLEHFGVFALVYAVYFFPWRALSARRRQPAVESSS